MPNTAAVVHINRRNRRFGGVLFTALFAAVAVAAPLAALAAFSLAADTASEELNRADCEGYWQCGRRTLRVVARGTQPPLSRIGLVSILFESQRATPTEWHNWRLANERESPYVVHLNARDGLRGFVRARCRPFTCRHFFPGTSPKFSISNIFAPENYNLLRTHRRVDSPWSIKY